MTIRTDSTTLPRPAPWRTNLWTIQFSVNGPMDTDLQQYGLRHVLDKAMIETLRKPRVVPEPNDIPAVLAYQDQMRR